MSLFAQMSRDAVNQDAALQDIANPFQALIGEKVAAKASAKARKEAAAAAAEGQKNKRKERPFLHLKTSTAHANMEKRDRRQEKAFQKVEETTHLKFRAVDAAGAEALRIMQKRSKGRAIVSGSGGLKVQD